MSGKFGGYIPPHLTTGSEEQGYVEQVFRQVPGAALYRCVNYGHKGGGPPGTKGVPDDLIFLPGHGLLLGWDAKAGEVYKPPAHPLRLTPEQAAFGAWMQRGFTTAFGWGDRVTAKDYLLALAAGQGWPQVVDLALYPPPKRGKV